MTFAHKHDAVNFHKTVFDNERGNAIAVKFARRLSIAWLQKIIAEKLKRANQ